MSAATLERYQALPEDQGHALDVLLDRRVSTGVVPSAQPQRLARQLRLLPRSPWVHVLDAVALDDRVVVVMPPAVATVAEARAAGLPEQRCRHLAASLEGALAELATHGMTPVTVDPARVGTTSKGGALLVPVWSPEPVAAADCTALLAALEAPPSGDPRDASAHEGTAQEGTAQEGTAQQGTPRAGTTQELPAPELRTQEVPAPEALTPEPAEPPVPGESRRAAPSPGPERAARARILTAAELQRMLVEAAPLERDTWRTRATSGVRQVVATRPLQAAVLASVAILGASAALAAFV